MKKKWLSDEALYGFSGLSVSTDVNLLEQAIQRQVNYATVKKAQFGLFILTVVSLVFILFLLINAVTTYWAIVPAMIFVAILVLAPAISRSILWKRWKEQIND